MTWWCRRPISSSARSRPAFSRSWTRPSCRTWSTSGRRSRSGWPATIPATRMPSTTCGARPASATTSRRRARSLGAPTARSTAGTSSSSRRTWPSSRTAACTCSTSSDDILPAALHYLGLDPNTTKEADLQKAADLMTKIRPSVRKFHSSEYVNRAGLRRNLPRGGLFRRYQAGAKARGGSQERRRHRLRDPEGRRAIVVRQSRHPARRQERRPKRYEFINYLQKPEVAAKNSNFISYANGNLASQKFIDKSILDDKYHLSGRGDDEARSTPSPPMIRRRSG